MARRTLEVRGRKVDLYEAGRGRPILYLHGFADLHALTDLPFPFHDALARTGHVTAPAHPGVGDSDELPPTATIGDVAFHYLEVIDALGLDRFDLVGHCTGGWIAAELAVLVPERIGHLALIGAGGLFLPGEPIADVFMHAQPERGVDYTTLRELLFSRADAAPALRYFPNGRGAIEEEVRRYQMLRFGSFVGFKPPYFQSRALIERLHRARMPSVVIWGEHDRFVPRAHGEAYARGLPGAGGKLHIVEGAGHATPVEAADATAHIVGRLLAD